MTGAPVHRALTPVKVEDTNIACLWICPTSSVLPRNSVGKNIRKVGENVQVGDEIAEAGLVVTPQLMSAAASIGYATIPVVRRPRVAVIATELNW